MKIKRLENFDIIVIGAGHAGCEFGFTISFKNPNALPVKVESEADLDR